LGVRRRPAGFGAGAGSEELGVEAGAPSGAGVGGGLDGIDSVTTGAGAGRGGEGEAAGGAGGGGGGGTTAGAGVGGAAAGAAGREGIATNSPGRHMCGILSTAGSLRNRSAWPQLRHNRVPSESSPPDRMESPPRPMVPVRSSFAHTKSDAPQLLQTGAKYDTRRRMDVHAPYKSVVRGRRES
jgi:hypothetical protein